MRLSRDWNLIFFKILISAGGDGLMLDLDPVIFEYVRIFEIIIIQL